MNRLFACRPSHGLAGFCASNLGALDLVRKKLLQGFGDFLWRTFFDDGSLWKPVAEQLRETTGSRQADVIGEPLGFFVQEWRKRPDTGARQRLWNE